jgi:hypothetical protein
MFQTASFRNSVFRKKGMVKQDFLLFFRGVHMSRLFVFPGGQHHIQRAEVLVSPLVHLVDQILIHQVQSYPFRQLPTLNTIEEKEEVGLFWGRHHWKNPQEYKKILANVMENSGTSFTLGKRGKTGRVGFRETRFFSCFLCIQQPV